MRQVNNIKASQEQELQAIEEAQKAQFIEFSEAWDKYMNDYENTAIKSLEKLKAFLHTIILCGVGETHTRVGRGHKADA